MASGIPAPLIRSGPWLLPGNNTDGGAEGVSPAPQGHAGFCKCEHLYALPFPNPLMGPAGHISIQYLSEPS